MSDYCEKCHQSDGTHAEDCDHRFCPHDEPCAECETRECEQ